MLEERTRELPKDERRTFFERLAWYRRRVESLETQAVLDDLTGLRNQRALWRELTRRGAAAGPEAPLSVVMIDFDVFHEVNERYGHAVGDAVLRRAAGVLRDAVPSPRLAFRYGGEEFVLIVPGDEEDARMLAEEARMEIAALNGDLPAVTVSCGVADFAEHVEPWTALDRADAALQAAKRTGRNRVVVSGHPQPAGTHYLVEEMEQDTARRAAMALAMATLEVRDRGTADHSEDVLALCESLGHRLGFDGPALERLMAGAQLHDVGKVAVPSAILNKPGPLDESEWAVIREHTVIGERILRSVPAMADVASIVRHSHEHWDGSGYPDGLAGEQIPLASRVILCADAFHAMRSDRPYRKGRSAADALVELRACAGVQFDPAVVEALVDVADDARRAKAGSVGRVMPRNKRLVALLATLTIGSGSAIAAIPEVRDAVRSLFGIGAAEPAGASEGTFAYDPETESFTFGPLGEKTSIRPTVVRDVRGDGRVRVVPRSVAVTRVRAGGRTRRGATLAAPAPSLGGEGREGGAQAIGQTRRAPKPTRGSSPTAPATPQTSPGTGSPPPTGGSDAPAPSSPAPPQTGGGDGTPPAPQGGGNGKGRALGKTLPTPRSPVVPPSISRPPGGGPPAQQPGRSDPPAIGLEAGPAPQSNAGGNGKGAGPKK